ncbi:MAG: DUF4435 domain-containing protein [Candidatus Methanomethylophilaceae archaeon]|nr:DUF4435 domain-containing protein [Candidatus Methanomethylophilaceae archaeon]
MREHLTSDDISNQVLMHRTAFDGTFLLVEGVTDERLFEKFASDSVRIVECHSKDNVKGTVKELERRKAADGVVGIVDSDLDRLRGRRVKPPLFHTDCRDMEMMTIRSRALDHVLAEYGDVEKLESFRTRIGSVRDRLIESSYPIGLLMYLSQKNGMNLSFKDLDFRDFINPRTMSLDASAMVNAVIENTRYGNHSRKRVLSMLDYEAGMLGDKWDAARGHDTVDILLLGLKNGFGSYNAKGLREGELGGALRLAFSDEDFKDTELYKATNAYAESNGMKLWSFGEESADASSDERV